MRCNECGGRGVTEGIETYCHDCGLILEENPFYYPHPYGEKLEIISFPNQTRTKRGINILSHNERRERNYIIKAFQLCEKHSLPKSVKKDSEYIIKSFIKRNSLKGKKLESYVVASVIVAAKRNNHLLNIGDIDIEKTPHWKKSLHRAIKEIKRVNQVSQDQPGENTEKLISSLNLGDYRKEIYETIESYHYFIGCKPSSIAPGVIYNIIHSYDLAITINDLEKKSGISRVTMKKVNVTIENTIIYNISPKIRKSRLALPFRQKEKDLVINCGDTSIKIPSKDVAEIESQIEECHVYVYKKRMSINYCLSKDLSLTFRGGLKIDARKYLIKK